MKRRFVQIGGELVEREQVTTRSFEVMPDFQPFVSNDGKVIEGRRQWREHLKQTGGLEMGHGDIKKQTQVWKAKQEANQAKLAKAQSTVTDATANISHDFDPVARSRLSAEVANRLHGKQAPTRRELINLAVELKRRGI